MHTNDALITQRQNQSKNEKHKKMLYKYYGAQYEYEYEYEYEYAYVYVIYVTDIYIYMGTSTRVCTYVSQYGNTSIWAAVTSTSTATASTNNETKRKSKNKERKPKAAAKPNKVCYTFLPLAINYALTALRTSTCMCVSVYECMGVSARVRVGVRECIVTLLGLNGRICLWLMAELV